MGAVRTVLMDRTSMIKTNIWVFFILYLAYTLISEQLFFFTSGGWIAFFFYVAFTGSYYVLTSILLFISAIGRTSRKRTKVTINLRFLTRTLALQGFVVLFNYSPCGDDICYQGFLSTLLEEGSIPLALAPPFVVVLLALLLYLCLLSLFLLDL